MDTLLEMLTYRRPHGSDTEAAFIERFIEPIATDRDDFGNLYVDLGGDILWSCHTDTVHKAEGRQSIEVHKDLGIVTCGHDAEVLGADNAAGVYLMLQMIDAGQPGTYIFHRAEERGGKGSRYIAGSFEDSLRDYRAAIALDRCGTHSIITHQLGGVRGCSDQFAESLGDAIRQAGGPELRPDKTGIFTDTANYFGIIPHCTNLSVGYDREHTSLETLNLNYLRCLRDSLCVASFDNLNTQPFYEPDIERLIEDNPREVLALLRSLGLTERDIEEAIFYGESRYGYTY